ncbi:aminotransferase, variant 2 [Bonamia ostreae]|uniref:Aminotransferase, variant 2 n=1 Tax=Bonamia ostreae TaxID=126728 RepID=A0ABV2AJ96_9EUKA
MSRKVKCKFEEKEHLLKMEENMLFTDFKVLVSMQFQEDNLKFDCGELKDITSEFSKIDDLGFFDNVVKIYKNNGKNEIMDYYNDFDVKIIKMAKNNSCLFSSILNGFGEKKKRQFQLKDYKDLRLETAHFIQNNSEKMRKYISGNTYEYAEKVADSDFWGGNNNFK